MKKRKGLDTTNYRRINAKAAEAIIKKTGDFKGYLRYRNRLIPFNTKSLPGINTEEEKIVHLHENIYLNGDYRGLGVSIWVDK